MRLDIHDKIDKGLFVSPLSATAQRDLFKTYVRNITLELFDYCNRQCPYCPVSLIDRRTKVQLMDPSHFEKIIADLKAIDFSNSICLNLFNEPMAHDRTYEAIDALSEALPKARIWFNSNGDYLNKKSLQKVQAAGLKRIVVTLHIPAEATYDDKTQITRISQLSARTGLTFNVERFRPNLDIRASARYKSMEITVKSVNYSDHGVNRGGAMEHIPVLEERTAPCDRPFHDLTIAWNGNVYPCCQFVEGFEDHKQFVVGNIGQAETIYELYCSKMMASFREDVFGYGQKRSPCDTCADQNKCRGEEDRQKRAQFQENLTSGSAAVDALV